MPRIGIVGGGPGGLMTAYLLRKKYGNGCEVVLLEAEDRLGGKLQTRSFRSAPVCYEAGIAELYDYSGVGDDPFRNLIDELGIATRRTEGHAVVLDGVPLRDEEDIERHAGAKALEALREFRRRAVDMLPKREWLRWSWREQATHPWADCSWHDVLGEVADPFARRYLQVTTHADLATEPHLTSGRYGLENVLMDEPGYVEVRAIEGGMSELARALSRRLGRTRIELSSIATEIAAVPGDRYRLRYERDGNPRECEVDHLVLAIPLDRLSGIVWHGERLRRAVDAHVARFDTPGHYLRVALLFEHPFWRSRLSGSWFTLEGHGGTCVYDESARYDAGGYGVLSFLFAGNDALTLGNLGEDALVARALATLPGELAAQAHATLLESRVHRWARGVNARPGGPGRLAMPEPEKHPGLLVVGAHLFDCTLNGVFRSADVATDHLWGLPRRETAPLRRPRSPFVAHAVPSRATSSFRGP
jgi:monoamine oxidase